MQFSAQVDFAFVRTYEVIDKNNYCEIQFGQMELVWKLQAFVIQEITVCYGT